MGEAFRNRLAAQADAALASGKDHPLHQLFLEAPPRTAEERQEQMKTLERLLVKKPSDGSRELPQELLDLDALHRAAENGDLQALAQVDKRLKDLLDSDEIMQLLKDGDLSEPSAKEALRLYRESFMRLEAIDRGTGPSCNIQKEALKAVTRDDVEELRTLLDRGLNPGFRNTGGQTLLELARERGSSNCEQLLLDRGATEGNC
mmetsp:Transcript_69933/g.138495  ORF Transcript_69933/g.138495 Transcript_69933/m.138495 type:complete len:204 (-) Transcript_69933:76-687(-)